MENIRITINGHLCESLEEIKQYSSKEFYAFVEEYFNDSSCVKVNTSGSTGQPKEIELYKGDMRQSARLTIDFFKLNSESLLYLPLSPTYIAGKMMIVRALELGCKIIEEKPSNTPLYNYSGGKIDLIAVVPSQLGYLFNNPFLFEYINNMIIGGAKLTEKVGKRIADMGVNAYATYGMTETCSHVALAKITYPQEPFKALGNISFCLDDRECLIVNTPHFSFKHVVTNDMVDLISDSKFYWLGRYDNVINTGGIKVFPEKIEEKLSTILHNVKFFVTSRPSEKWGEELILVLEYKGLNNGAIKTGAIKPGLIEEMKKILPEYSIPRYYVAVPEINMTPNGKICRNTNIISKE